MVCIGSLSTISNRMLIEWPIHLSRYARNVHDELYWMEDSPPTSFRSFVPGFSYFQLMNECFFWFPKKKKKRRREGHYVENRMSLVIELGPLDEKDTTNGANSSFSSILFCIVAVGILLVFNKTLKRM